MDSQQHQSAESIMKHKIVTRTPEEVFNLWIAALEGDKYRQVIGALKKQRSDKRQGFCCLGVLCDLASKDGGPQWVQRDKEFPATFLGVEAELPIDIRKFMGITGKDQDALIDLNDENKVDFQKIAKYIRTTIKPAALQRLSSNMWAR